MAELAHKQPPVDESGELHVFPGTFHGSVLVAHTAVSRREVTEAMAVLRKALALPK
jgi:hypothetical protein